MPRMLDRGVILLPVSLHQVDPGEELVGGQDTQQPFARDAEKARQAGAAADEYGIEPLVEQLVQR